MFAFKLVVLLIIALTGAKGQDFRLPKNTVAVVGDTAKLHCKYDSTHCLRIKWQKQSASGQIANISVGNRVYGGRKYQLDNSSICTLIVTSVQLTDSGTFICTIDGYKPAFGDLIVLQTKPTCSSSCQNDSTVENQKVDFTCELTYRGGTPVMNWWNQRTGLEELKVPAGRRDNTSVSRNFWWHPVAPGVDPLVCLTRFYFTQTSGRAVNVPQVECDIGSCNVLYSVRNVRIWPAGFASPDEKITCKADGNPEPSFEWQSKEDDKWEAVDDETSETIVAFLNNGTSSTELRCIAKNTINGVEYIKESPEVTISKDGAAKRIGIIVGVVVGLVILAIIGGVVYKFCISE